MLKRIIAIAFVVSSVLQLNAQGPSGVTYNANNRFEQLESTLPTPNSYRTASGSPGKDYWQQRADYDIKVTPTSITDLGVYTIDLTALDPLGLSATSSFTVSITNTAPSWSAIPTYYMWYNSKKSIKLEDYVTDLEGGPLTY